MRLRLYHHRDGARVAYRETGTGPATRAAALARTLASRVGADRRARCRQRFRVVLPDLPLHGDSEDRPRHPYTPEWLTEVIAGFCQEVGGPRLAGRRPRPRRRARAARRSRAVSSSPARLVLMPNRLHRRDEFAGQACGLAGRLSGSAALPGLDRLLVPRRRRSCSGRRRRDSCPRSATQPRGTSSATRSPTSAATATAPARGRSSSAAGRSSAQRDLLDAYPSIELPVLLLWADEDPAAPARRPRGGARPDCRTASCGRCPAPAS